VDPTTAEALTRDDIIEYIFETENSDEEDHDKEDSDEDNSDEEYTDKEYTDEEDTDENQYVDGCDLTKDKIKQMLDGLVTS
jgi:hypothetical protein